MNVFFLHSLFYWNVNESKSLFFYSHFSFEHDFRLDFVCLSLLYARTMHYEWPATRQCWSQEEFEVPSKSEWVFSVTVSGVARFPLRSLRRRLKSEAMEQWKNNSSKSAQLQSAESSCIRLVWRWHLHVMRSLSLHLIEF